MDDSRVSQKYIKWHPSKVYKVYGEYWLLAQYWPSPLALPHNIGKVALKTVHTKWDWLIGLHSNTLETLAYFSFKGSFVVSE